MLRSSTTFVLFGALCTAVAIAEDAPSLNAAETSEIAVYVSNIESNKGNVDCALFASEAGFPMDASYGTQIRQSARTGTVECRFENLPAGTYAVAVSHDENENGKTDTNFLGIPKEAWGVSNNARPKMRAPTFEEAAFELTDGRALALNITVK
ncbi:MAG: DUF2141 domain-containing protein [Woeseiaceae bacterium]|nr:DUF2141 domain-containing protein [Woeseiaceae bacterium]